MTTGATMYRLPNCRLFASGEYRGKEWPPETIDELAANGSKLGPLLTPPAVLGHEEDQEWLDRTDLPAAGWVDVKTLRSVPDADHPGHKILTGDVVNIPSAVAARLRAGEYRFPSVEVYDEFLDDFGGRHGRTIRRLALLGGEVPQVKRLGPLPMPVPMSAPLAFAERPPPARKPTDRLFALSFAERAVPTRADLIKSYQAVMPGVSQATLEVMTDDQLKELVANLPKPNPTGTAGMTRDQMIAEMTAAGQDATALAAMDDTALKAAYDAWKAAAPAANPDAAGDVAMMGDPAAMSREELIAELSGSGQDAAALESMTDDELRALYTSLGLGATAEMPAADPAPVAAMGDRQKHLMSDRRPARRAMTPQQVNRFAEQAVRNLQRAAHLARVAKVTAFADRMVRDGRYLPAQLPVLKGYLLGLDDLSPVHKFSDATGRTVQGSALERAMATVARGPVVIRFGEKVGISPADRKATSSAEVRKVEKFCELHESSLRKTGSDPAKLVATAKRMAEQNPEFTAADLIGASGAAMVG